MCSVKGRVVKIFGLQNKVFVSALHLCPCREKAITDNVKTNGVSLCFNKTLLITVDCYK